MTEKESRPKTAIVMHKKRLSMQVGKTQWPQERPKKPIVDVDMRYDILINDLMPAEVYKVNTTDYDWRKMAGKRTL
jgi:hypothetical protein